MSNMLYDNWKCFHETMYLPNIVGQYTVYTYLQVKSREQHAGFASLGSWNNRKGFRWLVAYADTPFSWLVSAPGWINDTKIVIPSLIKWREGTANSMMR